ncbi:MAG: hypothetical protein AAGA30_01920 [Planctomycetota bacterium]
MSKLRSTLFLFLLFISAAFLTRLTLKCEIVELRAAVAATYIAQVDGGSRWRMTRQGWVDLAEWDRPVPIQYERRIELIHPITFSALLLLFSLGMMIWASEEDDLAKFISASK